MPLLPSRRPRRGYRPDEADARDLHFDELGLETASASAASLRSIVPGVLDQGNTNTCVAQAVAMAILIRENYLLPREVSPSLVSRLFVYFNARHQHGMHRVDLGTYIRLAMKGVFKLGAPDERHWSFSTGSIRVNRQPPINAYMKANGRRDGTYRRIFDAGDARGLAVRSAIEAGLPVVFGTSVDDPFLRYRGAMPIDRPRDDSKIIGGHAMVVIGFAASVAGGYNYEILNSWGPDWGAGGTGWITEDYLQWSGTRDLWVVDGWAGLREAA